MKQNPNETPKPSACQKCRLYFGRTNGFCADRITPSTKVVALLYRPYKEDAILGEARFADATKRLLRLFDDVGFAQNEVAICHILRCYFPHSPKATLPKTDSRHALKQCRAHDQSLRDWKPDVCIYTFDEGAGLKSAPLGCINEIAIRKAKTISEYGYRPVVAFGKEVFAHLNPELAGGVSAWKLHIESPFTLR